jgi:hypothetical protein
VPLRKGSPHEIQAARTGNFIETCEPSLHASGAPLSASSRMLPVVFTIELSVKTLRASFHPVHDGGRTINVVGVVSKTFSSLGINITARARAEGHGGI